MSRNQQTRSLVANYGVRFHWLAELMLTFPFEMAHAARTLIHPGTTRPSGSGIDVPPISAEWLRKHEMDCLKHRDDP
jgi:hypothetical protein